MNSRRGGILGGVHTPSLDAAATPLIKGDFSLTRPWQWDKVLYIDKTLSFSLFRLLARAAGVKNNLPRGAGNFCEHFGPFVRGSTSPYRRNYFNIAPTVYFVCMPRRDLVFSFSRSSSRPPSLLSRQGESTRERPRSLGMILVRNPPWTGSFGSCYVVWGAHVWRAKGGIAGITLKPNYSYTSRFG